MSVAPVTALSTLFELAFFRKDPAGDRGERFVPKLVVRTCRDVLFVEEDLDGASPKMKNLMNAPINNTTDSWPTSNPVVNDSGMLVMG